MHHAPIYLSRAKAAWNHNLNSCCHDSHCCMQPHNQYGLASVILSRLPGAPHFTTSQTTVAVTMTKPAIYIVYPGLRSRMLVVHGIPLLIEVGAMGCLAAASVKYVCVVSVIILMWHLEQIRWWCRERNI